MSKSFKINKYCILTLCSLFYSLTVVAFDFNSTTAFKNKDTIPVINKKKTDKISTIDLSNDIDFACSLSLTSGPTGEIVCINTPITPIIYTTTDVTSITYDRFPPGVTPKLSGNTITISGTPTSVGSYDYVLRTNCGASVVGKPIVVNPLISDTISLSSGAGTNTQSKCINTTIDPITYTVTGNSNYPSVSGLPSGIIFSYSSNIITISGTPTVTGIFNYSVTLSGCGMTVPPKGTLTINPGLSVDAASSSPSICITNPIPTIIHTTVNATGIGTPTGLPAGVTAAWASNTVTISGTPTVTGTFNYTIPLSGGCGNTINAAGTITVTNLGIITLSSPAGTDNQSKNVNSIITPITYTTTGTTGATITGLPTGVTGTYASNTVTISGTPTVSGTFTYLITLAGECNTTVTGKITTLCAPITGIIKIIPGACSANVTANPSSQTITSRQTTGITLSSTTVGTTFSWTVVQSSVTGATAGTGSSITQTLTNTSTTNGTATYTITPILGNCSGSPIVVVVTVTAAVK